mgnify:CR=1 FL=1
MEEYDDKRINGEVAVWDPLVRVFHWSLVGAFAFAYLTSDEWDFAHEVVGYVVTTLIVIRILWAFAGTKHALFRDFIYRPSTVFAFLRDSLRMKARRYLGHNPAGGVMVIALLTSIAGLCITGILLTIEGYKEAKWLEEAHDVLANGALVLIGLHVVGVFLASLEHHENLVKSMFTGRKRTE